MPNKISPQVIHTRKSRVLVQSEVTGFRLRERYVGKTMSVLLEGRDRQDKTRIEGHTANFLPVSVENEHLVPNEIIQVKFIENTPIALKGVLQGS